jgi:hypothetical protein
MVRSPRLSASNRRTCDFTAEAPKLALQPDDVLSSGGCTDRSKDPGQAILNLPLRVAPLHHAELPVAEVTDGRYTSGKVPSQRLAGRSVDLFRRVPGRAQCGHPAVAHEVDMSVDQPRQHGRMQ